MPLTIVDLMEEVGGAPPPPVGGIPPQRCPGWIRWPLRLLALPFVCLDVWAQKIAVKLIRPPYKQVGHCLKRGNCCHYILIPPPRGWAARLFFWWNCEIYGFFLRDSQPCSAEGQEFLILGCRYLQKDGSCAHYRLRPTVCRTWPLIEHFGVPRVLKGCGFTAVPSSPKGALPAQTPGTGPRSPSRSNRSPKDRGSH